MRSEFGGLLMDGSAGGGASSLARRAVNVPILRVSSFLIPRLFALIAGCLLGPAVLGAEKPASLVDNASKTQETPKTIPRSALRKELLERVDKDQQARMKLLAWMREQGVIGKQGMKQSDNSSVVELRKIDKANRAWLKQIVEKSGWPVASQVGKDGAHAAWLLLQHADDDRKFQKKCLELMRAASKGEVSPADIAYLTDRIMINESGKQVYGTQLKFVDGKCEPLPLSDPKRVEELRKEAGLQPLEEYLKFAEEMYLGKQPKPRAKPGKKNAKNSREKQD